ncbi:hypothetical protein V2J09_015036 [Rumex salicifolius]
MATAAFKSTTKRSSIGGADDTTSSSSGGRRRTRSVSRFSHRLPSELIDFESNTPLPLTRRKFVNTVRGSRFPEISLDDLAIQLFSSGGRGRSSVIGSSASAKVQRRGRSVSRQTSSGKSVNCGKSSGGGGRLGADRRRRSLSAVRYRESDLESQSYSSTLTDDEPCEACYDGYENLQSMSASKKLDQLDVVQKKHRNPCEEIKTVLEQNQNNSHSQRVSRRLKEDAEKIIEEFISSVEDNTNMSSFDGERSDTSSALGVSMRPKDILIHFGEAKCYNTPPRTGSLPIEMDGVVFPWLLWETSNDDTLQFKDKKQISSFPNTCLQDEGTKTREDEKQSSSNRESWCPALGETISTTINSKKTGETTRAAQIQKSQLLKNVPRRSRVVDLDDYLAPRNDEDCLIERWKLRSMIKSGGIIVCESSNGPILL